MKEVGFEAYIKEVKVKSLTSGDKSIRVLLQIDNPPASLAAELDALHDPINPVGVAMVAIAEGKR